VRELWKQKGRGDIDLVEGSVWLLLAYVFLHIGVTINTYKVIYNLIDDVKAAMEGKLRAVEEKQQLGEATVRGRGTCMCSVWVGGGRGGPMCMLSASLRSGRVWSNKRRGRGKTARGLACGVAHDSQRQLVTPAHVS
jgi:hypothetical protein